MATPSPTYRANLSTMPTAQIEARIEACGLAVNTIRRLDPQMSVAPLLDAIGSYEAELIQRLIAGSRYPKLVKDTANDSADVLHVLGFEDMGDGRRALFGLVAS
jgi:hypothetical protein